MNPRPLSKRAPLYLEQMVLSLQNTTATSRHLRVLPPATPHFSLGLGELGAAAVGTAWGSLGGLAAGSCPAWPSGPPRLPQPSWGGDRGLTPAGSLPVLPSGEASGSRQLLPQSPPSRVWACHRLLPHTVTAHGQALLLPHLNCYSGFPGHRVFLKNSSYPVTPAQKSQMALCCPQNEF